MSNECIKKYVLQAERSRNAKIPGFLDKPQLPPEDGRRTPGSGPMAIAKSTMK